MPKAYSYVRMSTEAQAARGESLRRQLSLSTAYAKRHGLDLETASFQDLGISAFKGLNAEMGALGKFLRAVQDGKIARGSYLLVESLDRISREKILEALTQFLSIISADITIVTLADEIVYSKDSINASSGFGTLLISLTIMSRAHEESQTKSLRIRQSWMNKRSQALTKKLTAIAPAWLELSADRKAFTIREDRADAVRRMFQDCIDGIGPLAAARRFNEAQIPPWGRADGWHFSYIRKILTNRATIGEYQPYLLSDGRRKPLEPIADYYPQIISAEIFDKAQSALRSRRRSGGRKGTLYSNLFSGIVKCGVCGGNVHFLNKGDKPQQGSFLRCNRSVRRLGCNASSWAYSSFETNFLSLVREIDFSQIVATDASRAELNSLAEIAAIESNKLNDDERKLANLMAALENTGSEGQRLVGDRIETVATSIRARKENLARLGEAVERKKVDLQSVAERQNDAREIIARKEALVGDELYMLRSRLSQLIRESVRSIEIWPRGYQRTSDHRRQIHAALAGQDYSENDIELRELIYGSYAETDDTVNQRMYAVHFHNGQSRLVRPNPSDDRAFFIMVETDGAFATSQVPEEG